MAKKDKKKVPKKKTGKKKSRKKKPSAKQSAANVAPGELPIGAVIDWWNYTGTRTPPIGFQLCDGKQITDPRSRLKGKKTPNLVRLFVRGAEKIELGKGQIGGSDEHNHLVAYLNYQSGNVKAWKDGQKTTIAKWKKSIKLPTEDGEDCPLTYNDSRLSRRLYSENSNNVPRHAVLAKIVRIF